MDACRNLQNELGLTPPVPESRDNSSELAMRNAELNAVKSKMMEYVEANRKLKKDNEELMKRLTSSSSSSARTPTAYPSRESTSAAARPGTSSTAVSSGSVSSVGGTEYKVVRGDTLTKISRKHYGSASYVGKIREANKGRIGPNDAIYAGQTLILPAK